MRQVSKLDAAGQAVINENHLFLIPFAYKWKTMMGTITSEEFDDHIAQSLSQHLARYGSIVTAGPQQKRTGGPGEQRRDDSSRGGAPGQPHRVVPGEDGNVLGITPARAVPEKAGAPGMTARPISSNTGVASTMLGRPGSSRPGPSGTSGRRGQVSQQIVRDEEVARQLQDAINKAGDDNARTFSELDASGDEESSTEEKKSKKGKQVQKGNRKGKQEKAGEEKEEKGKGKASRKTATRRKRVLKSSSSSSSDEWTGPGISGPRSTGSGIGTGPDAESPDEGLSEEKSKSDGRDRRGRLLPKPTGKVFGEPCDKCQQAEQKCEVDVAGGACVNCKKRKSKCSHTQKVEGRRKVARSESGSGRPEVVSEVPTRRRQRASAKKANEIIDMTGQLLAHVNKTDKEEKTKKRRAGQRRGPKRESLEVMDVIQGEFLIIFMNIH